MPQPSSKSPSILLLHRDKLHAHAFFGLAPLHDGGRSYFSCRYIQQQLDESPGRRGLRSENVQPTQPEIVHSRDNSLVGSLPGQNRPFRTCETRVATKLTRGRHGDTKERPSLSMRKCRPSVAAKAVPTRGVFWKTIRKNDLSNTPRAVSPAQSVLGLENCSFWTCEFHFSDLEGTVAAKTNQGGAAGDGQGEQQAD